MSVKFYCVKNLKEVYNAYTLLYPPNKKDMLQEISLQIDNKSVYNEYTFKGDIYKLVKMFRNVNIYLADHRLSFKIYIDDIPNKKLLKYNIDKIDFTDPCVIKISFQFNTKYNQHKSIILFITINKSNEDRIKKYLLETCECTKFIVHNDFCVDGNWKIKNYLNNSLHMSCKYFGYNDYNFINKISYSLSQFYLYEIDLKKIITYNFPNLTHLNLNRNKINKNELATFLNNNTNIQKLVLNNNNDCIEELYNATTIRSLTIDITTYYDLNKLLSSNTFLIDLHITKHVYSYKSVEIFGGLYSRVLNNDKNINTFGNLLHFNANIIIGTNDIDKIINSKLISLYVCHHLNNDETNLLMTKYPNNMAILLLCANMNSGARNLNLIKIHKTLQYIISGDDASILNRYT